MYRKTLIWIHSKYGPFEFMAHVSFCSVKMKRMREQMLVCICVFEVEEEWNKTNDQIHWIEFILRLRFIAYHNSSHSHWEFRASKGVWNVYFQHWPNCFGKRKRNRRFAQLVPIVGLSFIYIPYSFTVSSEFCES